MNAPRLYRTCQGFEEKVAEIYSRLSRCFAEHHRLSQFWAEMALEELQHSSTLRTCREYGLFFADGVCEQSIGTIRAILERAEKAVSQPELNITEAFRLALEIESSEMDIIYEKLTQKLYRPYPFLVEAFHMGYSDHLRRFGKAFSEFCNDTGLAADFERLGWRHASSGRLPFL